MFNKIFWNDNHSLLNLGYKINFDKYRYANNLDQFDVGRVIKVNRDRYIIADEHNQYNAEIIGSLRYSASSAIDLPAIGDWVAFSSFDTQTAYIHAVFERDNILLRKSAGKQVDQQIIAVNVNYGLLLQSVNRDFNLNRLERYLAICYEADIEPIIILTKIDLIDAEKLESILNAVKQRLPNTEVLTISTVTGQGLKTLNELIKQRYTYCLLGSSGVGKSTLINHLLSVDKMKTAPVSEKVNKGKHATTHRELLVLPNGGIIIDNPGMREIGIINSEQGLEQTFDIISDFAKDCKFRDCQHINESNCAVKQAVDQEQIDQNLYKNYLKLIKEEEHHNSSLNDQKRKDKKLAKRIKASQRFKNK